MTSLLSDADSATNLEDGLRCDTIKLADGADCGTVIDSYAS